MKNQQNTGFALSKSIRKQNAEIIQTRYSSGVIPRDDLDFFVVNQMLLSIQRSRLRAELPRSSSIKYKAGVEFDFYKEIPQKVDDGVNSLVKVLDPRQPDFVTRTRTTVTNSSLRIEYFDSGEVLTIDGLDKLDQVQLKAPIWFSTMFGLE